MPETCARVSAVISDDLPRPPGATGCGYELPDEDPPVEPGSQGNVGWIDPHIGRGGYQQRLWRCSACACARAGSARASCAAGSGVAGAGTRAAGTIRSACPRSHARKGALLFLVVVPLPPGRVGLVGIEKQRGDGDAVHGARAAPALPAFGGRIPGLGLPVFDNRACGLCRPAVEQLEAVLAEFAGKPGGNVQPDLVRAVTADDIERGLDLAAIDRLRVVIGVRPVLRTGAIEIRCQPACHRQPGCRP